jgi:hypothetical protein
MAGYLSSRLSQQSRFGKNPDTNFLVRNPDFRSFFTLFYLNVVIFVGVWWWCTQDFRIRWKAHSYDVYIKLCFIYDENKYYSALPAGERF